MPWKTRTPWHSGSWVSRSTIDSNVLASSSPAPSAPYTCTISVTAMIGSRSTTEASLVHVIYSVTCLLGGSRAVVVTGQVRVVRPTCRRHRGDRRHRRGYRGGSGRCRRGGRHHRPRCGASGADEAEGPGGRRRGAHGDGRRAPAR